MSDLAAKPPPGFEWPAPWEPIPDESFCRDYPCFYDAPDGEARPTTISAELQREMCHGHPLEGVPCRAVARSRNPHEFVFVTAVPGAPVAFVHLTWRAETDPRYPRTRLYESWAAFRAAWERADHG